MPLLDLWETSPETVGKFTVKQVVSFAGDGRLTDNSLCSVEFRSYISKIPSQKLSEYAQECLADGFDKSGLVLQDLVNELGRRLDFNVIDGKYTGRRGQVGNDGLWKGPEHEFIIEVKTTDAYRLSLDTVATYRNRLISASEISSKSSILIVVGREDTGELEAQVRGSRHAWDVRIVSVEALIKLVFLKENSDDQDTVLKIRSVLAPVEYTRIDALVDVVFTAATDVESELGVLEIDSEKGDTSDEVEPAERRTIDLTPSKILREQRDRIIDSVSDSLAVSLLRRSRATYWTSGREIRVACALSKRYDARVVYWYAYHTAWREFITETDRGYYCLGCVDKASFFLLPSAFMEEVLPYLNATESGKRPYWHLHLVEGSGKTFLVLPSRENIDLREYEMSF